MRLLVILLLASGLAYSQSKPLILRQPTPWPQLTRASGRVFSGVVIDVRRSDTANGTTQITFRVENAIRGVRRGQIIRVREWAGLWNVGERYAPGERVLLFLYPDSKLGLTSPVRGRWGRYPVDASGRVLVASPELDRVIATPIKTITTQIRRARGE